MHISIYILIILLSVLTGWGIAWLTIKIIFHPRKPLNLFGFNLQGIYPKNQQRIAESLAGIVSKEFLSSAKIEEKVTNPDIFEKLKPEIESHVDNFLNHKLKEVFPMLSMFIGEKTISQFKGAFLSELETLFPVLMKNYVGKLQEDLNLEKLVIEKVTSLSPETLEQMLLQAAKKELRFFKIAAALFGLLMGLIQAGVIFSCS
ncbi:MAG: DUF445 family protein [Ferruginibacter sp.]